MNNKNEHQLEHISGRGFYLGIVIVLCFIGFFGVVVLMQTSGIMTLLSIPFLIAPLLPLFSSWGSEIHLDTNRIREFNSFFGFRFGPWKTMVPYTDIVIQTLHYTKKMGGMNSRSGLTIMGIFEPNLTLEKSKTQVFLMTPDHRRKILVAVAKNGKEAVDIALNLSEKTGRNIRPFNPKISAASRARKYGRRL